MKEIITTLEPRQIHHLMALHNSVIFDSNDRKTQKIIKGIGLGAYQDLKSEGLQDLAEDVVFDARREKRDCGGKKFTT